MRSSSTENHIQTHLHIQDVLMCRSLLSTMSLRRACAHAHTDVFASAWSVWIACTTSPTISASCVDMLTCLCRILFRFWDLWQCLRMKQRAQMRRLTQLLTRWTNCTKAMALRVWKHDKQERAEKEQKQVLLQRLHIICTP